MASLFNYCRFLWYIKDIAAACFNIDNLFNCIHYNHPNHSDTLKSDFHLNLSHVGPKHACLNYSSSINLGFQLSRYHLIFCSSYNCFYICLTVSYNFVYIRSSIKCIFLIFTLKIN